MVSFNAAGEVMGLLCNGYKALDAFEVTSYVKLGAKKAKILSTGYLSVLWPRLRFELIA